MCRAGCPTQDHATWGDCVRAANIAVAGLESTGSTFTRSKAFDAETERFRQAERDGLRPEAPTNGAVEKAYREHDKIEAAKKKWGVD